MKKLSSVLMLSTVCVLLDGCGGTGPLPLSDSVVLDTADNITVNGQNVTFTYNPSSQSNGFVVKFSNVGNASCNDVSIKATSAYGIVPNAAQFIPSPINTSMPQYTCTKTGSTIQLFGAPPLSTDNFRPWLDNFTITVGSKVFTVTTNNTMIATQTLSRGTQTQMNLDASFPGCGAKGTVLQRVYDCSKMIVNYGATVTAAQATSGATGSTDGTYYTKFINNGSVDPSAYWFVVSCPAGAKSPSPAVPQQSCAWLTPIVESNQPALDTANIKLFTLNTLANAYQPRLLFSGKLTNGGGGYTFEQTNGYQVGSAPYHQTYLNTTSNPGNGATTPTPSFTQSVCITGGGGSLAGGGAMNAVDAGLKDSISGTTGATVSWQVPNYPMLNILTGGHPTTNGSATCKATNGGDRPRCDEPTGGSNKGFNAISIPGFAQSNLGFLEWTWSSSSDDNGNAWVFIPRDGGFGGHVGGIPLIVTLGVRCSSPAWF